MSDKYRIRDQRHAHFVTFTVMHRVDFFTRVEYKDVFIKSIRYCQEHKGLEVYGYCIMPSHIHLILRSNERFALEDTIRDLKRHTSQCS